MPLLVMLLVSCTREPLDLLPPDARAEIQRDSGPISVDELLRRAAERPSPARPESPSPLPLTLRFGSAERRLSTEMLERLKPLTASGALPTTLVLSIGPVDSHTEWEGLLIVQARAAALSQLLANVTLQTHYNPALPVDSITLHEPLER